MSSPRDWTRRNFLQASLAAGTVPLLRTALHAAEPVAAATAKPPAEKLFLFVDWFHVKKGELQPMLDPARISPEGKKQLDNLSRDFGKTFDQRAHGFRPTDVPSGIRITPEIADKSQPWLLADRPWERSISAATVLFDEGRYRCWYAAKLPLEKTELTVDDGRTMELKGSALAYAESPDGVNWTKPSLALQSYQGSTENNLVTPFHNGGAVFRDDHGPAEQRYKLFHFAELPAAEIPAGASSQKRYGLYGVTSPDGYRWTKHEQPLIRYFSDTFNIAAWDPVLRKYVGYFRHHLSGRTISRAETDDFWKWPEPQPLLYGGPLDAPADDYYTNGYTAYPGEPSLRLLFPAIYHRDSDAVDVRLAVSRDGRAYSWVSYQPIIPLGRPGAWDGGSIYSQPTLVRLPDRRLALSYNAYNTTHNETWFQNLYGDYGTKAGVGWATWQEDRLAGIQADHLGQFTMNSSRFDGREIQINARTTQAGSVEVELRERGKPVEGFTFVEAVPFSGDSTRVTCRWNGKDDLSSLRGKNLEIAFRLRSAKLFACRFA